MAKANERYQNIVVESFIPDRTSGLHGSVHVRPTAGQGFSTHLRVECSKSLARDYPVGTRFLIRVKLTDRLGEGEFLYSSYKWPYKVLD